MGAFDCVIRMIKRKFQMDEVLLAVLIDVVIAFNSLPWEKINEAMETSPLLEKVGSELHE